MRPAHDRQLVSHDGGGSAAVQRERFGRGGGASGERRGRRGRGTRTGGARGIAVATAAAVAVALGWAPRAEAFDTVNVGYFSTSLPLLAAQQEGFLAAQGIAITTVQVRSSVDMFTRLAAGTLDVVFSSPDNPVNYRLNPNNAIHEALDVQMLLGTDHGLDLSLVAQPQYTTVESLSGKNIAVDAIDSGYAFVVYQILADHGLTRPGVDYDVFAVGGTPIRLRALLAGGFTDAKGVFHEIDATLLNSDSYVRAVNAGKLALAPVSSVAFPYLGGVASARQSWLAANTDVAVRFIRAYVGAQDWALNPSNHDAAVALLTNATTSSVVAEQIYDVFLDATNGLLHEAWLDREGLYQVLLLRSEWGGFEQPEDPRALDRPSSGIYDLSYWQDAVGKTAGTDDVGDDTTSAAYVFGTDHSGHGEDADGDVADGG